MYSRGGRRRYGLREEHSMDRCQCRPELSERSGRHWSIRVSVEIRLDRSLGAVLSAKVRMDQWPWKFVNISPETGVGPWMALPRFWGAYPLRRNDYQNNSVNIFSCNCPGAITGFSCRAPENNSPKIVSCMGPCPVRAPPVIAPGALTGFSCRAPENNSKIIFSCL